MIVQGKSATRAFCVGLLLLCVASMSTMAGAAQFPGQGDAEEGAFHDRVGRIALKDGDLTVAAHEFNEAARLTPSNAVVWYNLGVVESRRKNPKLAIEHLQRALRLGLPAVEKAAADELLATMTYKTQKTGADVKDMLYGVGFGLSLEQVRSRRLELGTREASQFGARYDLYSRQDAIGEERTVSLYFGEDGLQRIWADFGTLDPMDAATQLEQIEGVLKSRGFLITNRKRQGKDRRLPTRVEMRKGANTANVYLGLIHGGYETIIRVDEMRMEIYDSSLCPRCGR
jgi:tetratricopeptide (TPR) repeat protein